MKLHWACLAIFLLFVDGILQPSLASPPKPNDKYRPGDWVSYGVTRYISSVTVGPQYAYFGSSTGILRYDVFRSQWETPMTTSDGLADNQIFAVAYDPATGFLWCSTHRSASFLNPSSLRWSNFFKEEIGIPLYDELLSIGIGQQFVWFEARSRRLFKLDKFGTIFRPADVSDLAADEVLWFGARGPRPNPLPHFFMPTGYLFDPNGVVEDFRLGRAVVTGVVDDKWGNLWFGTWGLGAWRANVHVERAERLAFGLAQYRVDALAFDDRGLWVGGKYAPPQEVDDDPRGITYWKNPMPGFSGNSEWEYYEARFNLNMSSDEVNRFAVDKDKLYCATEFGISIYDLKNNRWRRIVTSDGLADGRVNDVLVYRGFLWAATDRGVNRITLKTIGSDTLEIASILPDQLGQIPVYDLERTENLIWLATDSGPFIFDAAKTSGGFLAENEGPRDERTFAISHADSVIWLGTEVGVEAFNMKSKTWLGAPARQLFPHSAINCLLAQPEAVWVGTNSGVFKYHRQRQEWRQYTVADGLLDNRVNAIAVKGDFIWFGTASGLTVFRWKDAHRID